MPTPTATIAQNSGVIDPIIRRQGHNICTRKADGVAPDLGHADECGIAGGERSTAQPLSLATSTPARSSSATSSSFADPLARIFDDPDHSADESREIIVGQSMGQRLLIVSFNRARRQGSDHRRPRRHEA